MQHGAKGEFFVSRRVGRENGRLGGSRGRVLGGMSLQADQAYRDALLPNPGTFGTGLEPRVGRSLDIFKYAEPACTFVDTPVWLTLRCDWLRRRCWQVPLPEASRL